nr:uncharacterized protein LOC113700789 [Coffea arabica]
MLILPNGKVVSEEEEECEGMPSLVEEEDDSSDKLSTHEEIGCLVVRKVLTTRAKEEEIEAQRDNLFYTRFHIKDKVYSVVIDSGSYKRMCQFELGSMKMKSHVMLYDVVPMQEFEDIFPEDVSDRLPSLRGIEHQIDLIPGAPLPNKPAYRMGPEEMKELQRQVEKLLRKGWGRENLNSCAVHVILVPKKDGVWRMCTDCRAVNAIMKKYRHPIPRSLEEHLVHLKFVFEIFRKEMLYANLKKCAFYIDRLVFLGYVISAQGIHVDKEKVKAIQEWPKPTSVSNACSFHGLASFYRRFVKDYNTIVAPLTAVMKKNGKFF